MPCVVIAFFQKNSIIFLFKANKIIVTLLSGVILTF